jgi:hypothetical protein
MDLSACQPAFGVEVAGIIGYDVLSRAIVEMDLEAARLGFHDPAIFELRSGAWQDLVIHNRHPHVEARFEGNRSGLFKLDIGAGGGAWGNIVFHTTAVRRWNLLEDREISNTKLQGLDVALGTIEWFEFGGQRFGRTEVVFARDGTGPFTDVYTTGNIGIGLLQSFRITFDYSRERIALLPSTGERPALGAAKVS